MGAGQYWQIALLTELAQLDCCGPYSNRRGLSAVENDRIGTRSGSYGSSDPVTEHARPGYCCVGVLHQPAGTRGAAGAVAQLDERGGVG